MNALEVININKIYTPNKLGESKVALSDFSLTVEKGAIYGLLGPNGAGKSTLINILAGTVQKSSGKALIMGVDIDDDPRFAKTKIGIVPQELVLDTFFPVAEALEFYAGYYGIRKKDRKTSEILTKLGLKEKANMTSRQLSGGMKRRFLVAKAMVHSPELLILDEPTAGVDIELRDQLWEYVIELNRNGTTIILTTHYLEEAEKLCTDIGFIDSGKLIKSDKKDRLLENLSQKEIIVTLSSKIASVPALLSKYKPALTNDKISKLSIEFNKNIFNINQILCDINAADLKISDISIKDGKLENIFRSIYKKN